MFTVLNEEIPFRKLTPNQLGASGAPVSNDMTRMLYGKNLNSSGVRTSLSTDPGSTIFIEPEVTPVPACPKTASERGGKFLEVSVKALIQIPKLADEPATSGHPA